MSGYIAPQQPIQPQAPTQPVPHEGKGLTVCGVVGVVFGALGFVLSFIPIINNIAAILGFVGLILSIVALVGTFRGRKRGKALAVVAAVLSVLSIVVTLGMQSATSKAMDEAVGTTKSQSSAESPEKSQPKGEQDMEGDLKTMHVKIVSVARSNNDYNNQPTVLVTFEWTNNTDKNNSFAVLASPQVFQNGQALDVAVYSENPAGYDANSEFAEVQPGATGTVTIGYVLGDDSEVTVDVTDLFDPGDTAKVTHKFTF